VKCLVGFYAPDKGMVLIDGREIPVATPRDAARLGIGMVYQHFTLVPSMSVAENLVVAGGSLPAILNWRREREKLAAFMDTLPFAIPLDRPAASLAAGEKQKVELVKQLYLKRRLLILDEPTSVLTPDEADEVLGLVKDLANRKQLTALIITHKFREVLAYADDVSVLRRGRFAGGGSVAGLGVERMAEMMVGSPLARDAAARAERPQPPEAPPRLVVAAARCGWTANRMPGGARRWPGIRSTACRKNPCATPAWPACRWPTIWPCATTTGRPWPVSA